MHLDSKPAKTWPATRSAELLQIFLARHQDIVAVLLGRVPCCADSILEQDRVIAWHSASLIESMWLVTQSDLFLGVDSCFLHAADLGRVPGVGLFGPTQADHFGFRVGPGRTVQGPGTMEGIEVAPVLDALEAILSSQ